MDHDWLLEMLALRIDNKAFLNLIRKWLKAGILDTDGQIIPPGRRDPSRWDCLAGWLNRRGGKRRSFTWKAFTQALATVGVARPRITEQKYQHAVFA